MTPAIKLSDTDMCVKCGLCLPHCPTYRKTQDENESPRGRISLIQGWTAGALEAGPKLLGHMDNCLMCRACERVCPALVPYGQLMDEFRNQVGETPASNSSFAVSALKRIIKEPGSVRMARVALMKLQRFGTRTLLRKSGLDKLLGIRDLERLMPNQDEPAEERAELITPPGNSRGRVGLFVGCMGDLVDAKTVNAAIRVLTRLGYEVHVPSAQHCCGALHLHSGDGKTAAALAAANLNAYETENLDAIVTLASGCGATLKEYPVRMEEAQSFSGKIKDISQFLADTPWPDDVTVQPLETRVCLHTPCTLRNVLREPTGALKVLQKIPDIEISPLPDTTLCCGSAGSYMLEHPDMAKSLREDVLEQVLAGKPAYLATSNIGCALHLTAGLREKGTQIEVIHPIALLDRQLTGQPEKPAGGE